MKFGQLILKIIVKIVDNKCQILRLKMHLNRFHRLQHCPDSLAEFKGPYF